MLHKPSKMKILITGGKGYIARNLKPMFEQAGYTVCAPSRTECDLLDFKGLEEYCKDGFDVVVHAAARGGKRLGHDTFDSVYLPNIEMFENLIEVDGLSSSRLILLGSGAEFDRREHIINVREDSVHHRWPIDPYGLSKNIITRQAEHMHNTVVLRLFGCFNWDDDPSRFIRAGIFNLKRGLPIEIHQNRMMSYFYLDDIFMVMDHVIHNHDVPKSINLVYESRTDLLDIASLIHKHTKIFSPDIKVIKLGNGLDYTGDGTRLKQLPISLIGLEEGIRRTINKLT